MFARFATRRILFALTSTLLVEQDVSSTASSFARQCAVAGRSSKALRCTVLLALLPIPLLRRVLRSHRGSLVAALFASAFWSEGAR